MIDKHYLIEKLQRSHCGEKRQTQLRPGVQHRALYLAAFDTDALSGVGSNL
jgi:hypothetical protein